MERKTRSQRRQEYRQQRVQRAIDVIEGKDVFKSGFSKGNKTVLFVIFIICVFSLVNGGFMRKAKDMGFNFEEYMTKYTDFVDENASSFEYDKTVLKTLRNKKEYSIVQNSTSDTNTLVAVYENAVSDKKDSVGKVAAVGRYTDDMRTFLRAFAENATIVYSTVGSFTYRKSVDDLIKMGLIDEDGLFINAKENIRINFNDYKILVYKQKDSIVFNIERQ